MDKVHLTAALEFMFDGGANQFFVKRRYDGLNRNAILRRRLDYAHVAQANKGHMQRAWNRRGRHGENIDFFLQLLEPLLVPDAKTLLLIHYQKT